MFQLVKTSSAATEGSAPGPLLFGAHTRRDTLGRFVKEVSGAMIVRST